MTVVGAVMVARSGMDLHLAHGAVRTPIGVLIGLSGVLLAVQISLPNGARLIPALLVLGGGVLVAVDQKWLTTSQQWWVTAGLTIFLMGLRLLLAIPVAARESVDPVRCVRTFLVPRRISFAHIPAPGALQVICVGGVMQVDLSQMSVGVQSPLELSVSAYAGRVEVRLPSDWLVVPGRLHGGDSLRLEGRFDDTNSIEYLGADERNKVTSLATHYSAVHGPWVAKVWSAVLNVNGWFSEVVLTRS